MYDLGFDGLNIDYENVQNDLEATQMVDLLSKLRTNMDAYASATNTTPFILSYACPAGKNNYEKLELAEMDKHLDFWDFMAYDYAGPWDQVTGHMANLLPGPDNIATQFNTVDAVKYYVNNGIAPEKINLGLPLYGRSWGNTDGPGTPFKGTGDENTRAPDFQGSWDYKELPTPGAKVVELPEIGASYMYDSDRKLMVSYDTPAIARQKAKWLKENGLGGIMFWEVSGDKTGEESLVKTTLKVLGRLENSTNHLAYPKSQYAILREGKEDVVPQKEKPQEPKIEVGALTSTSTFVSVPAPTPLQPEVVIKKETSEEPKIEVGVLTSTSISVLAPTSLQSEVVATMATTSTSSSAPSTLPELTANASPREGNPQQGIAIT
jgi:chitinase